MQRPRSRKRQRNPIEAGGGRQRRWPAFTAIALLAIGLAASPAHAAGGSKCLGLDATIVGTNGDDVIIGTSGDDVINAGKGNDTIHGNGGNDVLCGGKGTDAIFGGPGDDLIKGGPSPDYLFGNAGDDQLFGNGGNDIIDGGVGVDGCSGQAADHRCETAASKAPAERVAVDPLGPDYSPELEAAAIAMVNEIREERGREPLTANGQLTEVARNWAETLSERDELAHNPDFDDQIGGDWQLIGENVGYGPSIAVIQESLEASRSHRANILRSRFTDIGIGIVIDDDRIWMTQNFADYHG